MESLRNGLVVTSAPHRACAPQRAGDRERHDHRRAIGVRRVLTSKTTATAVPTVVIVFPSDDAFTPFKPKFNGKPIDLSGLFLPRRDANYIALVRDWDQGAMRVVFHEYAHLITSNLTETLPVWLNEGLAEFYSTFQRVGDREALIGRPVPGHLEQLNVPTLLPLEDLINVKPDCRCTTRATAGPCSTHRRGR
jgi:hypothetical protein